MKQQRGDFSVLAMNSRFWLCDSPWFYIAPGVICLKNNDNNTNTMIQTLFELTLYFSTVTVKVIFIQSV